MRYVYIYVFARNHTGELTVWDLEVFTDVGTTNSYGEWKSETIDLHALNNKSISDGTFDLKTIGFYYGDISNVDNLNNIEHSKEYLSKFDYIVHDEPGIMTARDLSISTYLNSPTKKSFAYTHIGWTPEIPALTEQNMKDLIDRTAAQGWYGVFLDMAGYDYGVTRTRLNTITDYAHTKGLKVMANAWTPADLLSSTVNTSTNSLGQQLNPTGTATSLGDSDWVLLESFYSRSDDAYVGQTGVSLSESIKKYTDAVVLASPLSVKVASLAYKFSNKSFGDLTDKNNSYMLSVMCGLDGWSFGTTNYSDNTKPSVYTGNSYLSSLTQTSTNRWERETNRGTIWFSATTSPSHTRSSGIFGTVDYLDFSQPEIALSNFNAGLIELIWETGSDKLTWTTWDKIQKPKRYVKLVAKLRS